MRSTTGLAALACLAAVIAIAAGRPQASSAPQQDHAPQPPGGLSSTAPAQEQETRPRFRADIELVQLDVSVLARDRKPVGGLTAADFTVLENGRVRPIRAFAPVQLSRPASPAPGGWATTVTPDVATNQIGAEDGRLVIILMDRSIPVGPPTTVARRVATAAIEALGPQDLAAVVSTSGGIPQNLTADRTRLIDAIDQRDWSTRISKEQEEIVGKEDPLSDGR
ncbi:MAG TPA: hypothetical protein VD833_25100, partial [Vicinamibacterales bacterium]|nr:hypothetical protein [Vicinamibacterales bacterium]